jgi:CheY-like chemotaxis protein
MMRISLNYARVLVVDDFSANLELIAAMMKPYNMVIDCVKSGQLAIDAIRCEEVKYNAVFMDHMMPKMDGVEAVRIIREEIGTEYAKNIPIIALTANTKDVNEEFYLSKGFQAFVPKPLDKTRLETILREWVRDEELEKKLGIFQDNLDQPQSIILNCVKHYDKIFDKEIAGLDYEKGLDRFGGDKDSYIGILRSFTYNTRSLLDSLKNITEENLADYAINVHAIKGSCLGIGAVHLGDTAEALEDAAKAGALTYVKNNNPAFIDETERLIKDLEEILPHHACKIHKQKKNKPNRKWLLKLLTACDIFDIVHAEAAVAEIEKYEYKTEVDLVLWLRENINQMNFMEISEKLSPMLR